MGLLKKAGLFAAKFFGILSLIAVLTEGLLRILDPPSLQYYRRLKLLHIYNDRYFVGLAPGADYYLKQPANLWEGRFTTNSLGYRGSAEPDDRPKILCLGDSMVMGFGVSDQDTFCAGLNDLKIGNATYTSMNLGVDAFGSMGSARRLEEAASKLRNIKIALFIVSPNDFRMPPELRARGILSDDETDAVRDADPAYRMSFRVQFEITHYSYVIMALKLSYEQLRIRAEETRRAAVREMIQAGIIEPNMNNPHEAFVERKGFLRYFRESFYRPHNIQEAGAGTKPENSGKISCPEPLPEAIKCEKKSPIFRDVESELPALTRRSYDEMAQTARMNGFTLIPVFLPIDNHVLYCESNGLYSREYDYALIAQEYFRRKGIRYMELRPYISGMCGGQYPGVQGPSRISDQYIPGDGHFTVAGNKWARDAIASELRKMERLHAF